MATPSLISIVRCKMQDAWTFFFREEGKIYLRTTPRAAWLPWGSVGSGTRPAWWLCRMPSYLLFLSSSFSSISFIDNMSIAIFCTMCHFASAASISGTMLSTVIFFPISFSALCRISLHFSQLKNVCSHVSSSA
jgi:hypothetical protein